MSDHLPECPMLHEQYPKHPLENCDYCNMLRACEQRIDAEWRKSSHFILGVQAARDAVDGLDKYVHGQIDAAQALAAIDNLITKNSGENNE